LDCSENFYFRPHGDWGDAGRENYICDSSCERTFNNPDGAYYIPGNLIYKHYTTPTDPYPG